MKQSFGLFLLSLFVAASTPAVLAARPPLVLAFYYAWYDENIWKPDQVADMPITPYTSRDPQTIARQIQQARGAGIDAFVVSWWGARNPTDDNFKVLLDQARAAGFTAAVDFELTSPFYTSKEDAANSLRNLLVTHVQHPAYLRVDGKPVIFFWREQKYSVEEWRAIRDAVDPNRQSLWIAEGVDTSYLRVFDGHHLYSVGWAADVMAELQKWPRRVRAFGADKIWVATVMPGNDDTRTRRSGAYVRDRRSGDFYRETWRAAFSSYPDWIIITSWNEWVEGTMIEPSVTYGDLYLNITREFAAQFKAGLPAPTLTLTPPPKPTAARLSTPTPAPPSTTIPGAVRATVNDILRVRAEPSTDSPILGRLREGAVVTLLARSEDGKWWQIPYPDAKRRGWIAAEFTTPNEETSALPIVQAVRLSAHQAEEIPTPPPVPSPTPEPTQAPPLSEAQGLPAPTWILPSFEDTLSSPPWY